MYRYVDLIVDLVVCGYVLRDRRDVYGYVDLVVCGYVMYLQIEGICMGMWIYIVGMSMWICLCTQYLNSSK